MPDARPQFVTNKDGDFALNVSEIRLVTIDEEEETGKIFLKGGDKGAIGSCAPDIECTPEQARVLIEHLA